MINKNSKLQSLVITIALFTFVGCSLTSRVTDIKPQMHTISKNLDDSAGSIEDSADKIKDEADAISKKVPGQVDAETKIIKSEADSIKDDAKDVKKQAALINDLIKKLEEYDKRMESIKEENEKLKSDEETSTRNKVLYMVLFGIACIGFSVMMFINGNPKSIGLGAGAIVIVITSLAVSYFSKPMAAFGAVAILALVALIIYKIIESRKDKEKTNNMEKANLELTHTVEAMKEVLPVESKTQLFGTATLPGHIHNIQSESTKEIVHNNRVALRKKFEPTIRK